MRARAKIPQRRGIIFIAALGVIIILTGLVLVFAQGMRTESLAAANRLSYLQADAVEQGAEKWVLANVEANTSDAATITQIPANALQLASGNSNGGYFWLLNPDPDSDQIYQFGIVDESAKLNVNYATATQLMALPNMTDEIAASIVAWRGPDATNTSSGSSTAGATSSYYQTLAEPYAAKAAPFESLEELLLIKDVDQQLMYGYDLNHDGVISADEQAAGGVASSLTGVSNGTRGIANDLTVYSVQPNQRVPVSNAGRLQASLAKNISASRASAIINRLTSGNRGRLPAFTSLADFYQQSGMSTSEGKLMIGQITATTGTGVASYVDVNSASREVLAALLSNNSGGGTTSSDADALISARGSTTSNSTSSTAGSNGGLGWIVDALGPAKAFSISDSLTSQSYQYSADIVAVSPDGRAFKRVKIVVDDRSGSAKIVFRKDLTSLGWPLSADIRSDLRSGKLIAVDQPNSNSTSNSVTGS